MKIYLRSLVCIATLVLYGGQAYAGFELQGQKTIDLKASPVDVTVSQDGKWTFILTSEGKVQVLTWGGDLVQTLEGGDGFNRIEFSQLGNRLILSSTRNKTIRILTLELIHAFDIDGSPYKGPVNAPVIVTVFNDFQ
jgi:WD40 repeat protein